MCPYFVSFQPAVPMEENLPPYSDPADPTVAGMLERAAGVLLPQYVTQWRYREITRHARAWFPRLNARFANYGKTGQIMLFCEIGVRYPESRTYSNPGQLYEDFQKNGSPWGYPLVLKGDLGGGGSFVFPIYQAADLPQYVDRLPPGRGGDGGRRATHAGDGRRRLRRQGGGGDPDA